MKEVIKLKVGDSLQEAIDRAPEGAVICLPEEIWEENIVIEKSLTLRGADPKRTVIKSVEENKPVVWIVKPLGKSSMEVILENVALTGALGAGLAVDGLFARVILKNLQVSGNGWFGFDIRGSVQVSLINSTLLSNGWGGVFVAQRARVNIENTLIEGNKGNGILVADKSHIALSNTTIRNNTGWGIAAMIRKCLYPSDEFTGTVLWKDRGNKIYNNGKGDICLP